MGTCYYCLSEAVLTSIHNLCFRAKIRKKMYSPVNPFYYIKVGFKGVYIICSFPGMYSISKDKLSILYFDDLILISTHNFYNDGKKGKIIFE